MKNNKTKIDPEQRAKIFKAFQSLPRHYLECFLMKYYEEMNPAEIAKTLDVSTVFEQKLERDLERIVAKVIAGTFTEHELLTAYL